MLILDVIDCVSDEIPISLRNIVKPRGRDPSRLVDEKMNNHIMIVCFAFRVAIRVLILDAVDVKTIGLNGVMMPDFHLVSSNTNDDYSEM